MSLPTLSTQMSFQIKKVLFKYLHCSKYKLEQLILNSEENGNNPVKFDE